ncbi:M81 family metallopeptidase [Candidatus Bathyarchaeota archaeon]|nr:M81 family metallopeptidase [Candidatus Bathyarchaeota archaeon]
MRIALASFSHETCTFCPRSTEAEDFERVGVPRGDEVIEKARGVRAYLKGFIDVAEKEGVELVGVLDASRSWGGSSGSWLTPECFDAFADGIADGLKDAGKLDGVYLALHGAMAAEEFHKPEAEIVRRARAAVGDIPIMVTLDLHANEDHELTDAADAVFIIKTYPHVDTYEAGATAANWMIGTVRGEVKPTTAIRKPGVISPSVFQGTGRHPGKTIMDRCREWEAKEEGVYVSVAFGFAYADVPDGGASVIANTNGDQGLADRIAQDVSDLVWELRGPLASRKIPKTKEGVAEAIKHAEAGRRPVVLADHSDRLGDSTHVLRELIAQGAKNFGLSSIADPFAAEKLAKENKVGDRVTVSVGSFTCNRYAGEPVELTGTIEFLGSGDYRLTGPMMTGRLASLGPTAVLDLGQNNHVVISSTLHQCRDSEGFLHFGIDMDSLDIMAIKSRVHFRAYFEDIAAEIIEVDAPGLGPADLSQYEYVNEPEGLYPISPKWRK